MFLFFLSPLFFLLILVPCYTLTTQAHLSKGPVIFLISTYHYTYSQQKKPILNFESLLLLLWGGSFFWGVEVSSSSFGWKFLLRGGSFFSFSRAVVQAHAALPKTVLHCSLKSACPKLLDFVPYFSLFLEKVLKNERKKTSTEDWIGSGRGIYRVCCSLDVKSLTRFFSSSSCRSLTEEKNKMNISVFDLQTANKRTRLRLFKLFFPSSLNFFQVFRQNFFWKKILNIFLKEIFFFFEKFFWFFFDFFRWTIQIEKSF